MPKPERQAQKKPRRSGAYWEGNGPETIPARLV